VRNKRRSTCSLYLVGYLFDLIFDSEDGGSYCLLNVGKLMLDYTVSHAGRYVLFFIVTALDRLCGLVDRVPGYRSRGPCSIPGATRFSER
jgi:hypothetical protein